jgi:hypothetical protein
MASRIRLLLAAVALTLLFSAASAAEMVVIVSAKRAAPPLHADQVAAIFLGQTARLPDGAEVIPLDLTANSPLRDEFYRRVANKNRALLKAWWSKMVFTGRGQPPRELPDSVSVRKLVADNPYLIGYIDRAALDASVRPLFVLQ